MKRFFLLILISLSYVWGDAQVVVQRSGAANTVNDPRHMASLNEYLPTYADTAEANLPAHKGIDSAGAVIYTYDVKGFWYRQHAPKKWVRFGSVLSLSVLNDSTLSYTDGAGALANLSLPGKRNKFYYDGYGISMPNDSTFQADTAQLATLWDLNNITFGSIGGVDTSGRIYYPGYGLTAPTDSTFSVDTNLFASPWDLAQLEDRTFATHDLSATANRLHLWGTHNLKIRGQHTNSYLELQNQSDGGTKWTLQSVDASNHWMGTYSEPDWYEVYGDYGSASHYAQMRFRLYDPLGTTPSHMLSKLARGGYSAGASANIGLTASSTVWEASRLDANAPNLYAAVYLDSAGAALKTGTATPLTDLYALRLRNDGLVSATTLKTTRTAPAQIGTTMMVTTDTLGNLSFQAIPGGGVDTSGRTYYALNGLSARNDSTFILGGYLDEITRIKGNNTYFLSLDSLTGFYARSYTSGYEMYAVQQGDSYSMTQTYLAGAQVRNRFYWNTQRMYFENYVGAYSFANVPAQSMGNLHRILAIDQNDLIYKVSSLPEFTDNAAALAAGLQAGDWYHTAGVVKIVTAP